MLRKLSPSKKKKKTRTDSVFDIFPSAVLRCSEQLAGASEQLHKCQSCPEVARSGCWRWSEPSRPCNKAHAISWYSSKWSGSPPYRGTLHFSVSSLSRSSRGRRAPKVTSYHRTPACHAFCHSRRGTNVQPKKS